MTGEHSPQATEQERDGNLALLQLERKCGDEIQLSCDEWRKRAMAAEQQLQEFSALEAERDRLSKTNEGLVHDFNSLLISESRIEDRAKAAEALLAERVAVTEEMVEAACKAQLNSHMLDIPGDVDTKRHIRMRIALEAAIASLNDRIIAEHIKPAWDEGAEAMREACAQAADKCMEYPRGSANSTIAAAIRSLPLPRRTAPSSAERS
jgi:hypothetical protein